MLLRYVFNGPIIVGKRKPTPSGRIYNIGWKDPPEIEVADEDVEFFLSFRGYCCTGGRRPMFEYVNSPAANAVDRFSAAMEGALHRPIENGREIVEVARPEEGE